MLQQIASFLVDVVVGFFVYLLLARFLFQWLRVPFRNVLGEFIIAGTNWMVLPARRVIPGLFGLDMASLVCAWLIQVLLDRAVTNWPTGLRNDTRANCM